MKRSRFFCVLSVGLGLMVGGFYAGTVSAQVYDKASIEIIPPVPTSADLITLRLSGLARDLPVPEAARLTFFQDTIHVYLENSDLPPIVPTPWSLDVPLGRLEAGTYRVIVLLPFGDTVSHYGEAEFIVAAVPVPMLGNAAAVLMGFALAAIGLYRIRRTRQEA